MDGVKWVSSSVSCYSFNHLQQTWKAFLIHVIWRRVERSVYLNWKRDMVRATGVKLCTQFLNNVSRHWNMSFESMREATEQQISNHSFQINFIYFFSQRNEKKMHSESEVLLQGQSLPLNFEQSGLDFLSSNGKNWIKIFHFRRNSTATSLSSQDDSFHASYVLSQNLWWHLCYSSLRLIV